MATKKIKPLYIIIILAIIIIGFIIFIIINNISSNPYRGKQTEISNLSEYTSSRKSNKDVEERIKYNLYEEIKRNVDASIDVAKISDVLIRNNTFSQNYDENTKVNSVYFIVDINSLKQTYQIAYQWNDNGTGENLSEWGTYVKCPTSEQLIYDSFSCKDMFTEMSGSSDPLAQYLPYFGELFEIIPTIESGKITNIEIKIYACTSSITDIAEESARKWLTDRASSLDDYKITTSYCNL